MHTGATAHKHAHIHSPYRCIASGGRWKKAAFPSPLVWPRFTIHPSFSHSSTNSSISLSFHSDVPRACSCPWETDVLLGIMAQCHIFLSIYILFWGLHRPFSQSVYGMHVSVFALFTCLCVESWSRCLSENAVTTAPNPPCAGICSPPAPHICSCVFAIAAACSQPPHFFLFYPWGGTQNKGEKVAQFPPLGSHTPTETHPRSNTLSPHAQCLAPLSDLHMSPSSSLMHRHTVELFQSLR